MRSVGTKKRFAIAGLGLSAAAFLGACAPDAPAPTTAPPAGVTTTTNVTYACAGSGIIGPGGASPVGAIANQTTSVAITMPASATVGTPFNVSVNVGNLQPGGRPVLSGPERRRHHRHGRDRRGQRQRLGRCHNFVGNGASINLNPVGTTATAASAGAKTVTVGAINILSGSTGFVCTPVGAGASASVTAS